MPSSRPWVWVWVWLALALVVLAAGPAAAHEFRPALLQLTERPPSPDRPGQSFDLRLVTPKLGSTGPIPDGGLTPIVPEHCELSSVSGRRLDCGTAGLVGELGVDGLERHGVDAMVEVRFVDGTRLGAVLGPDDPLMLIDKTEAPGGSVFVDYVVLGIEHILIGVDHLLFVLGLVLLVQTTRALLWTVTAFTLAHSVTLAASTLGLVTLPGPPVEAGIALSIVLLARELALGARPGEAGERARATWSWRYPWLVAFAFGLLHGFGFAGALSEVGLPADQIPLALLAFNVGVELGQLGVVAISLLSFAGLGRLAGRLEPGAKLERAAKLLPIWIMGGLAFAWTVERVVSFWG